MKNIWLKLFLIGLLITISGCAQDNVALFLGSPGNTSLNVQNGAYTLSSTAASDAGIDLSAVGVVELPLGQGSALLSDGSIANLNFSDGYLYYTTGTPGKLYRISANETKPTVVLREKINFVTVCGDVIFYRNIDGELCAYTLPGKQRHVLAASLLRYAIDGQQVYYSTMSNDKSEMALYCLDLRTMQSDCLYRGYVDFFYAEGDKMILACNPNDPTREGITYIYTMDISSKKLTLLTADECHAMNVYDDVVYYRNGSDGNIYRINKDGSSRARYIEGNCVSLCTCDGYLIYRKLPRDVEKNHAFLDEFYIANLET